MNNDRLEFRRAELGVDGNCAFALLGENIQEGEAEFVEIENIADLSPIDKARAERVASFRALDNLRSRLNDQDISYWLGPSHPNHC
jgi:hypothetical protein